jgi:hypothetical protein
MDESEDVASQPDEDKSLKAIFDHDPFKSNLTFDKWRNSFSDSILTTKFGKLLCPTLNTYYFRSVRSNNKILDIKLFH